MWHVLTLHPADVFNNMAHEIIINNIPVKFPFPPYPCQINYITSLLTSLSYRQNAILESPTGTGKSLCCLCAVLSWREHFKTEHRNLTPPRVIYCSRTHSQLTQVIRELKKTGYSPDMCVLGSRDQMCIDSQVKFAGSSVEKTQQCIAKVKSKTCSSYTNMERIPFKKSGIIQDIEDMVQSCEKQHICPYYTAKAHQNTAELIFMPYNYLLDHELTQQINVQDAIIIFDEAHNIASVCEDGYSSEIDSLELKECIDKVMASRRVQVRRLAVGHPVLVDLGFKLGMLLERLERFDNYVLMTVKEFRKVLRDVGITQDDVGALEGFISEKRVQACEKVRVFLSLTMFALAGHERDYFFYCESIGIRKVLYLWCFNPAIALSTLTSKEAWSIVLTSGTLSPLNSLQLELGIPFPVMLENSHVIEQHQLLVSTLSTGCDSQVLDSTYKNRSSEPYMKSLGYSILNFLRIIPDGVLIFFSSYSILELTLQFWEQSGILDKLKGLKMCFYEPRNRDGLKDVLEQFNKEIIKGNGAVLCAVCKGKVSEGIDFSDAHARAVIITGLPFPPRDNPKISAKLSYLDRKSKIGGGLDSAVWYRQQAFRAVNQAIGRVIRHKDDFGVVLLLDPRFKDNISKLPAWIRASVVNHERFGGCVKDVATFFRCQRIKPVEKVGTQDSFLGDLFLGHIMRSFFGFLMVCFGYVKRFF